VETTARSNVAWLITMTKATAKKSIDTESIADSIATVLVKIVRSVDYPPPHSADVHPDELDEFKRGGWVED